MGKIGQFFGGLLAAFSGLILAGPVIAADPGDHAPNRYIVVFHDLESKTARAERITRHGGRVGYVYSTLKAASAQLPNGRAVAQLAADPNVAQVIPDRVMEAFARKGGTPPPPPSGQVVPAGVTRIGARETGYTGIGVGVAIMDSGLDYNHPDLGGIAPAFFTAHSSCQDDNSHGTHVGGIVAARDNTIDVVGVAPDAVLYCVKVLDAQGSALDSEVMAGFDWIAAYMQAYDPNTATGPRIRVVNVSLGRSGNLDDNPALRLAVQSVTDLGISVVAAAGNSPYAEVSSQIPAGYPEVIAVASTTAQGGKNACRWFSGTIGADSASYFTTDGRLDPSTGIGVTVSAPGATKEDIAKNCFIQTEGILSLRLGGGTVASSGTSMAAPHVVGVIAQAWEKADALGIALTLDGVKNLIRSTAARLGVAPLDSPSGAYSYDGEREGIVSATGVVNAFPAP